MSKDRDKLLDALYWMYMQYCSSGHQHMNAGEDASEILQDEGYIKVDQSGKVIRDNGDSEEQKRIDHLVMGVKFDEPDSPNKETL